MAIFVNTGTLNIQDSLAKLIAMPSEQLTVPLSTIALLVFALYTVSAVLLPFVVGFALAYLFGPVVDRMERAHMPRWLAAALITGASLLAVGVTRCEGGFRAGDGVELVGPDGAVFARGVATADAAELAAAPPGRDSQPLRRRRSALRRRC